MQIVDIGANLLDDMFRGIYNTRQCHPPDLHRVLLRAKESHIHTILVTAGSVQECREAIHLVRTEHAPRLFTTAGVHPTRASEALLDASFMTSLHSLAASESVVAVGECGLDYARTQYSSPADQVSVFKQHFALAKATGKPMFLHLRDAFDDFYAIVKAHRQHFANGVVHSFDGTVEQAGMLTDNLDLFIGINGCSLKSEQGIRVVKHTPLDRLMVESDAPWCDLRPSHASSAYTGRDPAPKSIKDKDRWSPDCMVKGRNEPAACLTILKVISQVKQVDVGVVADTIFRTTRQIFNI